MIISSVRSLGYSISRVRVGNDTILMCKDFILICESEGIAMDKIVPYSHLQLDRINRQWRTLVDGAKAFLLVAKLPDK